MNVNPQISVIIPVYNVEKYVGKCIESVINQTYKNLQVIIVNDGSTDKSGAICEEYAKQDSRIFLVTQENCGVSRARNAALSVATGEYIVFVDSDDWLEQNMFSKMLDSILKNNVDVCFCGYYKELHAKKLSVSPQQTGICNRHEALEQTIIRNSYQGMLWNKMFKREMIFNGAEMILFDESLTNGEDGLWTQSVLSNAETVFLDNTELYHYRVRDDSANFNKRISVSRMSELSAYKEANKVLWSCGTDLVDKNMARLYDKAHEMRVTSYIQKAVECEKIAAENMKETHTFFFRSKNFSTIYKIHHVTMNFLIKIHCPRKILNGIKEMIAKIYDAVR